MLSPEVNLRTTFKKIDVRRNKEYAKECMLMATVPEIKAPYRSSALDFNPLRFFRQKVLEQLPDAQFGDGFRDWWTVTLAARINAPSPKKIPADQKVRDLLPDDITIKSVVAIAYTTTQHEANQLNSKYERWSRTMQLLDWFCTHLTKQAKKNMRFEQRLKALGAEYQAEVMAIFDDELEDALKAATNDSEGRFCEMSIIYLKKYARQYMQEHMGNGLPNTIHLPLANTSDVKWIQNQIEPKEKK